MLETKQTEEEKQLSVYHRELYSIRDVKSDTFTAPFLAGNVKEAERIFGDMCYFGGDNLISRHPEDYCLYSIGSFDIRTGELCSLRLPVSVISAKDVIDSYNRYYENKKKASLEAHSETSEDDSSDKLSS